MIITIRKSDNKVMQWNSGNHSKNPEWEDKFTSQDFIPAGTLDKIFYDEVKDILYIDDTYVDPEKHNQKIKSELQWIDIKSIRSIREYIAAKSDAPQYIKNYESEAAAKRDELME